MDTLHISLFQRLRVRLGSEPVEIRGGKAQELLCFLVLFRSKSHSREVLAERLWSESSPRLPRRYLRKALWQLRDTIQNGCAMDPATLLQTDQQWIQIRDDADLFLDVAEFEQAYVSVQGVPGSDLTEEQARTLRVATELYTGDLLEGWYHDWCLQERQRYQFMYLAMLDKLISYCLTNEQYEAGIAYCSHVMQYDPSRERTHRQLMALHYHSGDRNAALEQYARCESILRQELDVDPEPRTTEVYQQICGGFSLDRASDAKLAYAVNEPQLTSLLGRIEEHSRVLAGMQRQIDAHLRLLNQMVGVTT